MWNKLKNFFKRTKSPEPLPQLSYKFFSCHIDCVGDWYEYEVKADSEREALIKLMAYFYGSPTEVGNDVRSNNSTVVYPAKSVRRTNMPYAIFKGIAGLNREMSEKETRDFEEWKAIGKTYTKLSTGLTELQNLKTGPDGRKVP